MKDKKRNVKTIIIIIVMCFSILGMLLTMNYAHDHVLSNSTGQNEMKENGRIPPDMNSNQGENKNEIPSKPNDNDSSNGVLEKSDGNDSNGDLPGGNKTNENSTMAPPNDNNKSNSSNLNVWYYVIFGFECLVLASSIVYLIMSRCNKKSFRETFLNKDKVLIGFLSVVLLTSGFTYLDGKITENCFLSEVNSKIRGDMNKNENGSVSYSASEEISEDTIVTSGEYSSTNKDENAILVSGDVNATLSNIDVNKTGDSDGGDITSFYGINSAIAASNGANLVLKNITVNTDATGANGVFSYGGSASTDNKTSDNTTITISDSTITTTKDNSGGIMTTGGGVMKANNLTVKTAGTSSAAIRTDRGGGTVIVDGGSYTTTGKGSPAIYSTADVSVSNSKLISKSSEGIVIEGKNSVSISNCELIDNNTELNGQSTTYKNIFLYQSMSGDAADGTAEFTATDSSITTENGDSFYVTNTKASINLTNNTIVNNDKNGNFLRIQKDSWGNTNSNGGDVTLVINKQKVIGNIVVDSISTLDMSMKTNSYYEGVINESNSAKSISLKLDKTSKIKLTGDSYITSLDNADSTNSNIDFNGYKLYVNGKSIN